MGVSVGTCIIMGISVCTGIWVSVSGQTYGCLCLLGGVVVLSSHRYGFLSLLGDVGVCVSLHRQVDAIGCSEM